MKTTKLALLVTSAIVLSACGGGGSGGGSTTTSNKPEVVNKSVNNQTKSEKPITNNTVAASQKESQSQKPVNKPVEQPSNNQAKVEKSENVSPSKGEKKPEEKEVLKSVEPSKNEIVDKIGSEKLRVLPKGIIKNEDVGLGVITGYNNKYSFNGAFKEKVDKLDVGGVVMEVITSKLQLAGLSGVALSKGIKSAYNAVFDGGIHREVFYFGDETPNSVVEKSKGTAIYRGVATRYDNVSHKVENLGKSRLNVDFDAKKISGELAMNGIRRNISLKETDIKGNQFNGKAVAGENSILTTREGTYEGKFFGPKADEVAGVARFSDKNAESNIGKLSDLDTSFSAEKQ